MTIKEMEALTGLSRANIRYYETEGLVIPQRLENGYRSYSEADAHTLLRVKLLRTLGVPIETLQRLHRGAVTLDEVLALQKSQYSPQIAQLRLCEEVTGALLGAGESYLTLDAAPYLQMLETGDTGALREDVSPSLNLPWRRYLARNLDRILYFLPIALLFPAMFESPGIVLASILNILLMLVLEPLFLHLFCTTPGKAIFGIRVTDIEGNRLPYLQALNRTFDVLWHGTAFQIPYLSAYFEYKCLKTTEAEESLPWEQDSELTFKDDKNWRYFVFLVAYLLLLIVPIKTIWENDYPSLKTMEPFFHGETPFSHKYQVSEVLYSVEEADGELPVVDLTYPNQLRISQGNSTRANTYTIGTLEYREPEPGGSTTGIWEVEPEYPPAERYCLQMETDGEIVLSHYWKDQLQWSWKLQRVDTMFCSIRDKMALSSFTPDWFGPGAFQGDMDALNTSDIYQEGALTLSFRDTGPDTLTLQEEYHYEGTVETRDISLEKDEKGVFSMTLPLRNPVSSSGSYSLFRISFADGEYIFGIYYRK